MLISLLGYFFCMVTTLTAVVAFLVNFSNNYTSAGEKGHYSRPIIVQTVTAKETAPWRSPSTKEASPAKDATPVVSTAKTNKPKLLARQRNNYGYGNEYAYRNDPRGFFVH
ncbi:MAG: hypothetical protein WAK55_22325 [Xanthobacteraceae bacterium]